MIRHIVEFKLASDDPAQMVEDAAGIRSRLSALVGVVPGLQSVEVGNDLGLVDTHWNVVLVSEHDSNADLEGYQAHPAHKEASAWIATVTSDRKIVDYER